MKRSRKLLLSLILLSAVLGFGYANRMQVLQYTLGWYTDWAHPRSAPQDVAWQQGPAEAQQSPEQRPPNIIVILADDLGINDVTLHGGGRAAEGVPTPNIDGIAKAGVRFNQAYAGSAVCTVSRAALLTGRYPWRFGVEFTPTPGQMARVAGSLYTNPNNLHPVLVDHEKAKATPEFDRLGMPPSEQTLAELLKTRGYHNIHIGKWHLGSTPEMRPNNQGFDESLFMESGLYLPVNDPRTVNSKQDFDPIDRFLWPNMRFGVSYNGGHWFEPKRYLTDYFTDEAVNAIGKNKNRPFFMYLAHWGVHTPLQASKEDYDALPHIKDHRRRVYGAMIRSVDRSVGRVLQALKDHGIDQNTLVIFSSDNGAPGYIGIPDVNQPYRGWKLTFFEGGLRVPTALQWPAQIAPGQQFNQPTSHIDFTPTAVAAAGGQMPTDRSIDGVNLLSALKHTHNSNAKSAPQALASRPLFWRDGGLRAVQVDQWKLIHSNKPDKDFLFNLQSDPTEKINLASTQSAKLAELKTLLTEHHRGMADPLWPTFIEMPIFIDKTLDQRQSPNDEYTYWYN
jgi:arylsulfatase A-like enzyme